MSVVCARDHGDPLARPVDSPGKCGARGGEPSRFDVAGGADQHDRSRRLRAAAHEPERDQSAPVEGHACFLGIVRSEAHAEGRKVGSHEPAQHGARELAVGGHAQADRIPPLVVLQRPLKPPHDDDRNRAVDVHVVRSKDDERVGSDGGEAAPELLHRSARPRREFQLALRAQLRDDDAAVRRDRCEDDSAHAAEYPPPAPG